MHVRDTHIFLAAAAGLLVATAPAAAATPNTKITRGPSGLTASTTATFKFKATVSGATFKCRVDAKDWASCESPKKYEGLGQGDHSFQVRARKRRKTDRTPATRSFAVDTVAPDTDVSSGPYDPFLTYLSGYTEDQTPSFEFDADEPGSIECRITSGGSTPSFEPCTSPFTVASPLARDAFYTFEARAIDEAGNVDATPGSWDFDVETPITEDQQTAELAAAVLFPDSAHMDVPASCGSSNPIDCPGGTPSPPNADQLSTASRRSVVWAGANTHRYDVTVTHDSQTLSPIVVGIPSGECNLTLNSAGGSIAHWAIADQLSFVTEQNGHTYPGGRHIASNPTLSGVEAADFGFAGSLSCEFANSQMAFYANSFAAAYPDMIGAAGPVCPKPGPGYVAPCTSP